VLFTVSLSLAHVGLSSAVTPDSLCLSLVSRCLAIDFT